MARGADPANGWDAACLERERREATVAILCIAVLVPMWIGFDALLEPGLVRKFLPARLAASAVACLLLAAARRARTPGAVRASTSAAIALTGPSIAAMLPHVEHFSAYLFGFSLYFWGSAALLSWPLRYSIGNFAWLIGCLVAALLGLPGRRAAADLVAASFYAGSAAVLACAMTYAHRRAHRRVFDAASALERRNLELADALERLHETQGRLLATEKLAALGRLLAGLSHEINNPVNVLHNNLEPVRAHLDALVEIARLAASADEGDVARARARVAALDVEFVAADLADATDTMRNAVDRIRAIHGDLRAFIRGDEPERVVGDVNEGLRATIALVTARAPGTLEVVVALEDLPRIAFQPGQLRQVWHNLLQNAIDAVHSRGRVTVRSRSDGPWIEVSVADDGPGVAPENQARMFEPFFTTKGGREGTGLGLAVSYEIVERHGGSMALDRGHAPGARFVVRLPAGERAAEASAA